MIDLDELERLEKGATPGPWRSVQMKGHGAECFIITEHPKHQWKAVLAYGCAFGNFDGDKFVAACREAVPALIAEVRRLRKVEEAARRVNEANLAFRTTTGTDADTRILLENEQHEALVNLGLVLGAK